MLRPEMKVHSTLSVSYKLFRRNKKRAAHWEPPCVGENSWQCCLEPFGSQEVYYRVFQIYDCMHATRTTALAHFGEKLQKRFEERRTIARQ